MKILGILRELIFIWQGDLWYFFRGCFCYNLLRRALTSMHASGSIPVVAELTGTHEALDSALNFSIIAGTFGSIEKNHDIDHVRHKARSKINDDAGFGGTCKNGIKFKQFITIFSDIFTSRLLIGKLGQESRKDDQQQSDPEYERVVSHFLEL